MTMFRSTAAQNGSSVSATDRLRAMLTRDNDARKHEQKGAEAPLEALREERHSFVADYLPK
jgi:hypothetical protein